MNKISGIYQIRNMENNLFYIGSSANIVGRWSGHKSSLNKGNHRNPRLQNSWNKYGETAFDFQIIESGVGKEDLLQIEQWYLDNWNPEYNVRKKTTDFSRTNGESVNTSKLTEKDVLMVRFLAEKGVSNADISKTYGVVPSCIGSIVLGKTWKHVGGKRQLPKRRVSDSVAAEIRGLWETGRYEYEDLVILFGLSKRTVARIVLFETHKGAGGNLSRKKKRLSKTEVVEIRRLWNLPERDTQKDLGVRFGVGCETIGSIVRFVTWKDI